MARAEMAPRRLGRGIEADFRPRTASARGASATYSEDVLTASNDAVLGAQGGNRPHLARWGRWLLCSWDTVSLDGGAEEVKGSGSSFLRLYLLEGA